MAASSNSLSRWLTGGTMGDWHVYDRQQPIAWVSPSFSHNLEISEIPGWGALDTARELASLPTSKFFKYADTLLASLTEPLENHFRFVHIPVKEPAKEPVTNYNTTSEKAETPSLPSYEKFELVSSFDDLFADCPDQIWFTAWSTFELNENNWKTHRNHRRYLERHGFNPHCLLHVVCSSETFRYPGKSHGRDNAAAEDAAGEAERLAPINGRSLTDGQPPHLSKLSSKKRRWLNDLYMASRRLCKSTSLKRERRSLCSARIHNHWYKMVGLYTLHKELVRRRLADPNFLGPSVTYIDMDVLFTDFDRDYIQNLRDVLATAEEGGGGGGAHTVHRLVIGTDPVIDQERLPFTNCNVTVPINSGLITLLAPDAIDTAADSLPIDNESLNLQILPAALFVRALLLPHDVSERTATKVSARERWITSAYVGDQGTFTYAMKEVFDGVEEEVVAVAKENRRVTRERGVQGKQGEKRGRGSPLLDAPHPVVVQKAGTLFVLESVRNMATLLRGVEYIDWENGLNVKPYYFSLDRDFMIHLAKPDKDKYQFLDEVCDQFHTDGGEPTGRMPGGQTSTEDAPGRIEENAQRRADECARQMVSDDQQPPWRRHLRNLCCSILPQPFSPWL